ncbi:MAG: YihY/virulence factor BrkB family protein [Rubellimicrobium sp.]|nr:YihY/virulence factor BrkB family protein [Rubellimicrobium sp.]
MSRMLEIAGRSHLGLIAAGVAFFGIFSVFPSLAVLIGLFGLVADPAVVETQLQMMEEFIPADAYALIDAQISQLIGAQTGTLGWATGVSLVIAFWSARLGVSSLVQGINAVHGEPERSGIWHQILSLLLTFALVVVAIIALLAVIVAPILLAFLPLAGLAGIVAELVRWVVAIGSLVMAFGLLYRYGPNGQVSQAWITPGSVTVVVLWLAASAGFTVYVSNFASYNEIYGSIGAVMAMMMWLYITAYLIMLGAAMNRAIEEVWTSATSEAPADAVAGGAAEIPEDQSADTGKVEPDTAKTIVV